MGTAIRAVEQTLGALRVSGQAFAEAIGLPSLLATYAGTRELVVLGNYLVRSEARCGAAFLADGAGDLRRAVAARKRFQTTKAQLLGRLPGRYGPGILDQNLGALLSEWVAAQGSNLLVKGSKLKKVAAQVQPYAEGPLPPDLGPDLTGLIEVTKHVKAEWRIRRVWSTEWWMDAEGALAKLDQRLIEDLEVDRAKASAAAAALIDAAAESEAVEQEHDEPTAEPEVAPSIDEMPSEPANDPKPVTDAIPQRLYAGQALPTSPPAPKPDVGDDVRAYRIADLNDLDRSVEPGRFYDASYRQALSAMVDHVLAVEGPIYQELLIKRIARAHDIQRVGPLVREAIADRIDASVARTEDVGRPVLWPRGEEPRASYPHRPASAAIRSHTDTPMPELVGIAMTLPSNASEAERARMIGQRIGLSRIEASARARFERASEIARQAAVV